MPNQPMNTEDLRQNVQAEIERLGRATDSAMPSRDYEQLDGTSPSPLPEQIASPSGEARPRLWPWVVAVLLAALLVVVGLASASQSLMRPVLVPPEGPAPIQIETLNEVQFNAWDVQWDPSSHLLSLALSVQNGSPRDLTFTVRGAALQDKSGKSYYPDLTQSDVPPEFFGRAIAPGTSHTARLVFAGLPDTDRQLTLVVRNVSDSYHFAWDYLLTLPAPEAVLPSLDS